MVSLEIPDMAGKLLRMLRFVKLTADSAAVLAIVRDALAADDPDARWQLALCGIHLLLSDLGLPMAEWISGSTSSFKRSTSISLLL